MLSPLIKDIEPGSPSWIDTYSLSSRAVARMAQLELAREDHRIYSIEGDLAMPQVPFHLEFPDRSLQIGIAEADMINTAVGLAMQGRIPFVNSFAAFLTMRGCEQLRIGLAYHQANVKLIGYYSGISGGAAATTHHCIEDLAIARAMPGMTVLAPADSLETYKAIRAAAEHDGPVYIRVGRADTPQVYFEDYPFEIGKAVRLKTGKDVTLMATGNQMVAEAVLAAEKLALDNIAATVLNLHTLKPLDSDAVEAAAAVSGAVVTVEDHNVVGGLGGAVAEVLAETRPTPQVRVGLQDAYCTTFGDYGDMLGIYNLDADAIVDAAKRAMQLRDASH
ncbi:MAG: transketolase family protein [Geminicoccaceae bacterium]